jgi:hypothetical protein
MDTPPSTDKMVDVTRLLLFVRTNSSSQRKVILECRIIENPAHNKADKGAVAARPTAKTRVVNASLISGVGRIFIPVSL